MKKYIAELKGRPDESILSETQIKLWYGCNSYPLAMRLPVVAIFSKDKKYCDFYRTDALVFRNNNIYTCNSTYAKTHFNLTEMK